MRSLLCLLVALSAVFAGPREDPFRAHHAEIKGFAKEQREYAKKEMKADLRKALKWLTGNWYNMEGRADNPNVWVPNVRGYEAVYLRWAFIDRAKGSQAIKLAKLNDPRAVKLLTRELFDTLKTIAETDRLLKVSRPKEMWWVHDQRPGVRRYGASIYRRYLVTALSSLRDAESRRCLSGKVWKKAQAFDRRTKRDLARIALIDIFAKSGCPHVEELLHTLTQSEEPRIRIVALEALAHRAGAKQVLRDHLVSAARDDRCYAVRAAAIDLLKELRDGRTIGPLAEIFGKRTGTERARIHATLTHIVGRDLGWQAANWSGWFEKHRARIERGGRWSPRKKPSTAAAQRTPTFDKLQIPSLRSLVIVDGNYIGNLPADIELAKTKNYWVWHNTKGRNRTYATQWDVLRGETLKYIGRLPENSEVTLLMMYGSGQLKPFPARGTETVGPASLKRSERFLDKFTPDLGWCAAIRAIWRAYEMAGIDIWGTTLPDEPMIDTIVLAADGTAAIGPLINLEATLADLAIHHRFFRIPIHCYRVGYTEEADRLMEGIAELTGGQYQWKTKP